jgi:hypothetical protein
VYPAQKLGSAGSSLDIYSGCTLPSLSWYSTMNSPLWNDKSATSTTPMQAYSPRPPVYAFPAQVLVQLQLRQVSTHTDKSSVTNSDIPAVGVPQWARGLCVLYARFTLFRYRYAGCGHRDGFLLCCCGCGLQTIQYINYRLHNCFGGGRYTSPFLDWGSAFTGLMFHFIPIVIGFFQTCTLYPWLEVSCRSHSKPLNWELSFPYSLPMLWNWYFVLVLK